MVNIKKQSKKPISSFLKYVYLVIYICLSLVLIIESCINGDSSAAKSNNLGELIANIFNGINGDQTVAINPTSVIINNKKSSVAIGDTLQLNTSTLPNDATYKALNYYSSNEDVAKVSNSGFVSFLKEGTTTISIENKEFPSIKDSMVVNVYEVEATSISSTIDSALKDNDGIYTLFLNDTYTINTSFLPENTTNKKLTFSCNSPDIEIDSSGKFIPKKHLSTATISIFHNDIIFDEINIRVVPKNIVPFSYISHEAIRIYESECFYVLPSFYPANCTYQDYYISTASPLIQIVDESILGLKQGIANITITPKHNIESSIVVPVEILPSPKISSFSLSTIPSLTVGSRYNTNLHSILPLYASVEDVSYSSSNTNVATIDDDGTIIALKAGSTTITVSSDSWSDSQEITIDEKTDFSTTDINLKLASSSFTYGENYSLSSLVSIEAWNPTEPSTKEFNYHLKDSSFGEIENDSITFNKLGKTTLLVIHQSSGIIKEFEITVVPNYFVTDKENTPISNLQIKVNNIINLNIKDNVEDDIFYKVSANDQIFVQNHGNSFTLQSPYEGTSTINILPYYQGVPLGTPSTLNTQYVHEYISSLDVSLFNQKTNTEIISDDNSFVFTRADSVIIKPVFNNTPTISNLIFLSDDNSILTVSNKGYIKTLKPGSTSIVITDTCSKLSKTIYVTVINKISLSDDPVSITGDSVTYKNNGYILRNGFSATLKINFLEDSTFTNATYNSSNNNIASISADGVITPHKVGNVSIYITIDDGYLDAINLEVQLIIEGQDFITDLPSFYQFVRKAVGHFAAFFFVGIFSSLTYLSFFKEKKRTFSIIINISQGILLASITEIIQLLVPGRTGSIIDVLIDSSGFLIAAIFMTVFLLLRFKSKEKNSSNE